MYFLVYLFNFLL